MTNRALDLFERARPLDTLESFIYRTARRVAQGRPQPLLLQEIRTSASALEFSYKIQRESRLQPDEIGALGSFTIAGALAVRALLTRKSAHVVGALQAASVALAFGGRGLQGLVRRVKAPTSQGMAVLGLQGSRLYFKFGEEEVWQELAPVVGLTVRTFRFHWDAPQQQMHYAQIEMQDGRFLTLLEASDSVEVRRLIHQLARPVPVEISFQNIDLYRGKERIRWELGPRLVEPALN